MTLVLRTPEDSPADVEILGTGVLRAGGVGGIPVEDAARTITELQKKDKSGVLVLDPFGAPTPLSGKALKEAAEEFARARGLEVAEVGDRKLEAARADAGSPIDSLLPDIYEVAKNAYEFDHGDAVVDEGVAEASSPAQPASKEEAK